ncbi:MAG: SpoIID/LytB domain-containing protein, partial [Chloroflexota bacterium]|nr:SpoIID/LytB domain-containing protein [Chloroflexota bacterium]
MKRFIFPLLFLLLPLLQVWPVAAEPVVQGEAVRLTSGAGLFVLEDWPTGDSILARRLDGEMPWLEVDAWRGRWRQLETPPIRHEAERPSVSVEYVTHRLQLGGKTLFTTDEEILGRPILSPDGKWVVVARYPRGNETASLGELWRYELRSGKWLQLTANGVEEQSPIISPDGSRVAFLRDGDIWSVPANRTTIEALMAPEPDYRSPVTAQSLQPPETIRVLHVASANNCRPGVPDGQIDVIPFEEYIKRVTPHESPPSWHIETLKAQAVAARSYAWRQILMAPPEQEYDVTDTTQHQYMCDTTHPNTNAAVDATRGQHLTFDETPIFAMFSAENSSPTKNGNVYLSAVDDPVSFGQRRHGHGYGFSQWGGKRWADAGWRYIQILRHYYPGSRLEPPASDASSAVIDVSNRPTGDYLRGAGLWMELNAYN